MRHSTDGLGAAACIALWLGLIWLAGCAEHHVQKLKRKEFWRSIMAGCVGLTTTYHGSCTLGPLCNGACKEWHK